MNEKKRKATDGEEEGAQSRRSLPSRVKSDSKGADRTTKKIGSIEHDPILEAQLNDQ